jgi:glucuronoarabinoxylan endo-1,4-beta-xylanase
LISDTKIPANSPVLIKGTGTFTFEGMGNVSTPHRLKVNDLNGVYVTVKAPVGSYYLKTVGSVAAFYQITSGTEPTIPPFSAYLTPSSAVTASNLPLKFDDATTIEQLKGDSKVDAENDTDTYYDFLGRRVYKPKKGVIYIKDGNKVVY